MAAFNKGAGGAAINNIRSRSTLQGIADGSGKLLLVNPIAGQLGTLAQGFLEGSGVLRFDINLAKRIQLGERFNTVGGGCD